MIFFTSDWHINHKNILEFSKRPYGSTNEMTDDFIKRFNHKVSTIDQTYFIGDTILGHTQKATESLQKLAERLNGDIIYLAGNHDAKAVKRLTGDSSWIKEVKYIVDKKVGLTTFTLCHYPMLGWNKSHLSAICLHGHTHQKNRLTLHPHGKPVVHVGVDSWDYYPASAKEILELV